MRKKLTTKMFPLRVRLYLLVYEFRYWLWWHFKATEEEKMEADMFYYGTGIMKDGKRVDPLKFKPENYE